MPAVSDRAMRVAGVTDLAGLDALREPWEAAHAADPHAHAFNSRAWVRAWAAHRGRGWQVLCARPGHAAPTAFALLHEAPRRLLRRERTLWLGAGLFADCNGPVCDPAGADGALAALARHIEQLRWDRLELREVADPRVERWLAHFAAAGAQVESLPPTPSPSMDLPGSWEAYLASLRPRARTNIRRVARRLERPGGLRARWSTPESVRGDVQALLGLWAARWRIADTEYLAGMQAVLLGCFSAKTAGICVLSDGGGAPVAAIAVLRDAARRATAYLVSGFDPRYRASSPGTASLLVAIRDAIERGHQRFDFLRGAEPQKLALGGQPNWVRNYLVARKR